MIMIWYDRIIDVIWKERITVNHNEIEWLLNRIDRIMDMIWKERMSVNHNEIDWLLNRIDDNDVIW